MKYLDEYRDTAAARTLTAAIARAVTRPWTIMEVCGGQTHTIVKYGLDRLLPPEVELVHGPGCPVCVTPLEMIDRGWQQAVDAVLDDGVRLAAADLHDGPRPGHGADNGVGQLPRGLAVAVFVQELH